MESSYRYPSSFSVSTSFLPLPTVTNDFPSSFNKNFKRDSGVRRTVSSKGSEMLYRSPSTRNPCLENSRSALPQYSVKPRSNSVTVEAHRPRAISYNIINMRIRISLDSLYLLGVLLDQYPFRPWQIHVASLPTPTTLTSRVLLQRVHPERSHTWSLNGFSDDTQYTLV